MAESASGGRLAFETTGATPRVLASRLAIGFTGTTGAASSGHRVGFRRVGISARIDESLRVFLIARGSGRLGGHSGWRGVETR
jgi:hypothetical protein